MTLIFDEKKIEEIKLEGIPWIRQKDGSYKCKYLKGKKCSIYKRRPILCKIWFCSKFKGNCKGCKDNCCTGLLIWENESLHIAVHGKDLNKNLLGKRR